MATIEEALSCLSRDNPVCLVGPPGIGKTAIAEHWAMSRDMSFVVEHPVIAQSIDYRGLPSVLNGEAYWLPIGALRELTRPECPPTLLLLDDVGQAPAPVQAALMQLVWARRLGDAALSDNVLIAMATNRVSDRSGVRPLLAALVGRVQMIEVAADPDVWRAWAVTQPHIAPSVAAYPGFRPDCFAGAVPDEPMAAFCTPRTLERAGALVERGVNSLSLLAGWVGKATAVDYLAYAESVSKLPNINEILDKPSKLKTKDPGMLHAVITLAAREIEKRTQDVLNLSDHMGGGWAVALVSAASGVFPALKQTREFSKWAVQHRELL